MIFACPERGRSDGLSGFSSIGISNLANFLVDIGRTGEGPDDVP